MARELVFFFTAFGVFLGAFYLGTQDLAANELPRAESGQGLEKEIYEEMLAQQVLTPSLISAKQAYLRKYSPKQLAGLIENLELSHFTFLYPVKIKGEKIPSILGKRMDDISVMAVWDGRLQAIPFQFDEYDAKSHYIYIEGVNPYPVDGTLRMIDGGDELIFMFRDAGTDRYREEETGLDQGKVLKELSFKDRQGRKRYAYIVEGNPERSDLDYVSSSLEKGRVKTSFFNMSYDTDNFLIFKGFQPHIGTASDKRVVDNVYFKMRSYVFSKLIRVKMNSADHIRIEVLGHKDGPVRSTLFIKIVVLMGPIPVFSMFSEINIYEQGIVMPNRTEVGKGLSFISIFKHPRILIYLDMHGLSGAKVAAEAFVDKSGKLKYAKVDGKMDQDEIDANYVPVPGDWIWINSGLGWDVFMALSFPEENLEGMSSTIYYLDDMNELSKHETFPGAEPRVGIKIRGLPNKINELENLDLEYAFWYPDTVGPRGPRAFNRELRQKPEMRVRDPL